MDTGIPLLTHVDINHSVDSIDIQHITNLHQLLIDSKKDLNYKMQELVDAMGGLNAMLQLYLSAQSSSKQDLIQIHNILLSVSKSSPTTCTFTPILQVSTTNTFLHRICDDHIALKIRNIVFSKFINIYITLGWVGWIICILLNQFQTENDITTQIFNVYYWLFCPVFIIFCIFSLLSLNIITTKYILNTFEFWFKLFYFIRFWICGTIVLKMNPDEQFKRQLALISFFIFFLLYCLLDGLKATYKYKAGVLAFGAIYVSLIALIATFQSKVEYYWEWNFLGHNDNINVTSLVASSLRIVAIFMWKQTFYPMYRSDRATLIKKSVKIEWID